MIEMADTEDLGEPTGTGMARSVPEDGLRLIDLGELQLLHRHVLPLFGLDLRGPPADDAAVVPLDGGPWDLVITTDPCPEPLANLVLRETAPLYNVGWLTVVVNVSDLAAMGAFPLCMVVSSEFPPTTLLDETMSYFQGVKDASVQFECPLVGGNVRERDFVLSTGTALGRVRRGEALTQGGGKPGHVVGALGHPGRFWAGILASRYGHDELGAAPLNWDTDDSDPALTNEDARAFATILERPMPPSRTISDMTARNLLSSGVDASDGLGESLRKLAERSGLRVCLTAEIRNRR